jgi:hypothetical protein
VAVIKIARERKRMVPVPEVIDLAAVWTGAHVGIAQDHGPRASLRDWVTMRRVYTVEQNVLHILIVKPSIFEVNSGPPWPFRAQFASTNIMIRPPPRQVRPGMRKKLPGVAFRVVPEDALLV